MTPTMSSTIDGSSWTISSSPPVGGSV
jgi:hypothetical protein